MTTTMVNIKTKPIFVLTISIPISLYDRLNNRDFKKFFEEFNNHTGNYLSHDEDFENHIIQYETLEEAEAVSKSLTTLIQEWME